MHRRAITRRRPAAHIVARQTLKDVPSIALTVRRIKIDEIPVRVIHSAFTSPMSKALAAGVKQAQEVIEKGIAPGEAVEIAFPDHIVGRYNKDALQKRLALLVRGVIKHNKAPLELVTRTEPVRGVYIQAPLDDQVNIPGRRRKPKAA